MYLAVLSLIYSIWDLQSLLWHVGSLLAACASQVALVVKNQPASVRGIRDAGSITGLGRSPEEGHGNSLQHSCLKNLMERGVWHATVLRVAQSCVRLLALGVQSLNHWTTKKALHPLFTCYISCCCCCCC